ncbi:DNA-binding transcriptional regulator CytR [Spirochaetia bacterium]|nr:DNA-binding transcriptional regulator CytR [Spirochaetia bacterium]
MATIIDIARVAGVSKSTVSRAFTNPGAVKPRTLELISNTAQELNYMPNALARAMITKKTETFAFIIHKEQFPVITNPFYGQILESVVEHTGGKGYSLYISSSGSLREYSFNTLLQKQVDGVIFASYTEPKMLQSFLQRHIPVVLVNSRSEDTDVCSVLTDDHGGIGQVVDYLVKKKHRDIGIIEGRFTQFIYNRRHQAFLQALKKYGLESKLCYMAAADATIHDSYNTACDILGGTHPPTALVCTNDTIAVGAIKAAHSLGLKVPGDVAITGYDNSSLCTACEPAITSVDANTRDMGAAAVDFLFRQIEGEEISTVTETVKTRLVERESA